MLTIQILGQFRLHFDGQQIDWLPLPKTTALLAYLLLHRSSTILTREQVAFALWPDVADHAARSNLRRHLYDLQKHLPAEEPDRPWLLRDRRTVRWNPEIDLRLDVAEFEADISQPETLTRAVSHYTGPLLPDVDEEWLLPLRAELHNRYLAGLETLVATHQSQSAHQEAYAWAERLLAEDPLREDVVQTMLQLAEDLDERSSVLRTYQQFRELLAEEIGVPPSPETVALVARLKPEPVAHTGLHAPPAPGADGSGSGQSAGHPSRSRLVHQIPEMVASFGGRDLELAAIEQRLLTPNGRLITITGPGGIGKTSLALAVAHRVQEQFADGAHFIELANLDESDSVLTAISDKLQQPLSGEREPLRELADFLREKLLLLVLDNFEHLTAQARLLTQLLQAVPGLQLLVTSRIRLHQPGEAVFGLQGLAVPEETVTLVSDDPVQFAGVQLFIERAQQALWDFTPDGSDLVAISQICRYLEGVPLAIELAAAWVRMSTVASILVALREDADVLAAQVSDNPRHESMRAVFSQSWSNLTGPEQKLCRALSVFRGGFTLRSAQTICQASLPLLVSLTDKSFLPARQERFKMHELLRQFAGERLAAEQDEYRTVRNQHRAYFLGFLRQRQAGLRSMNPNKAAQEIDQEIDNIRSGWRWAFANGHYQALERCVPTLFEYYVLRNLYQDGIDFFEASLAALQNSDEIAIEGSRARLLQAELLACTGNLNDRIGNQSESLALINASLALTDDSWGFAELRAFALWRKGYVLQQSGRFEEANAALEQSLTLYQHLEDESRQAAVCNMLGILQAHQGDLEGALTIFQDAVARAEAAQDLVAIVRVLQNLATCNSLTGRFDEAKSHYEDTVRYASALGDLSTLSRVYSSMGGMFLDQEDYHSAVTYTTLSVELCEANGFYSTGAIAHAGLAEAHANLQQYEAAARHSVQALTAAEISDSLFSLVQALINAVPALQQFGAKTLAASAMTSAIASPVSAGYLKERAQKLLDELEIELVTDIEACSTEEDTMPPISEIADQVRRFLASRS